MKKYSFALLLLAPALLFADSAPKYKFNNLGTPHEIGALNYMIDDLYTRSAGSTTVQNYNTYNTYPTTNTYNNTYTTVNTTNAYYNTNNYTLLVTTPALDNVRHDMVADTGTISHAMIESSLTSTALSTGTLVPIRTSSMTAYNTWVSSALYAVNGGGGSSVWVSTATTNLNMADFAITSVSSMTLNQILLSSNTKATPYMTDATSPSGEVSQLCGVTIGGSPPWHAFDNNPTGTYWNAYDYNSGASTNTMVYQLPTAMQVVQYEILFLPGFTMFPFGITIMGSNDGTNWDVILTTTTPSSGYATQSTYGIFPSTAIAYAYHRFDTSRDGDIYFSDVIMLASGTTYYYPIAIRADGDTIAVKSNNYDWQQLLTTATIVNETNARIAGDLALGTSLYALQQSTYTQAAIIISTNQITNYGVGIGGGGGDNFGSHIATQAVDLAGNNIIGVSSITAVTVKVDGTLWAGGTSGDTPTGGAGTRMEWIPSKAAFRAGAVNAAQWDDGNIGLHSVAFGEHTTAAGTAATAINSYASASGDNSFASGKGSLTSGDASMAAGSYTTAKGAGAFSAGYNANGNATTFTSGTGPTSLGSFAAGYASGGHTLTADGTGSVAMGQDVNAVTDPNVLAFGRDFSAGTTDTFNIGFGQIDYTLEATQADFKDSSIVTTSSITANTYFGDGANLTGIKSGDNFGSHIATMSIDMANFNIINISSMITAAVSISTTGALGYLQIGSEYIVVKGTTGLSIQNAINSLGQAGGTVFIPAGYYSVNATINLKSNIQLVGADRSTILRAEPWANWATRGSMLKVLNMNSVAIKNLLVDGNSANTGETFNGFDVYHSSNILVSQVSFIYSDYFAIYILGTDYVTVSECYFESNDEYAVFNDSYYLGVGHAGVGFVFCNNTCANTRGGTYTQYIYGGVISGNLYNNVLFPINIPYTCLGTVITNNTMTNCYQVAYIYGSTFLISGNNFNGTYYDAALLLDGAISAGIISNNSFYRTAKAGIDIGAYSLCTQVLIQGNTFKECGNGYNDIMVKKGTTLLIIGNSFLSSPNYSERAIQLQTGADTIIENNITSGHDTSGITIDATYQNAVLSNNSITDTVRVVNNSTNTIIYDMNKAGYGVGTSTPTTKFVINNGSITVQGTDANITAAGRIRSGSIWHVVGGTHTIATVIPCSQNVWSRVTNATNNLWQAKEYDGFSMITDSMVITYAADYAGMLSLSYSANTGNDWQARIYNITQSRVELIMDAQSTTGDANTVVFACPFYFENTANDKYIIEMVNLSSNDDITIHSAYFYAYYLHD